MHRVLLLIIICLITLKPIISQDFPYQNSELHFLERVNDLMSRMTLKEKIAQMSMLSLRSLITDEKGMVTAESLDSLFHGLSIGCLESPFIGVDDISKLSEAADTYLRNNTRLGIPAIQIAECLHGQLAHGATIFPQAIGLGSTWNRDLIEIMSATIAKEASLSGVDQALSPLFDLARDPRYGRVEECYGEDPFLVAEMGKAFVTGMQGDPDITQDSIPQNKLICTAKHYAGYSTPKAGLNLAPVNIGPRDLRNLHLYPFEKAVKEANVYSVMPSYNEVNGIPLHANEFLMKDILRKEFGFQGYVFSDYGAIWMLEHFHHITATKAETAIRALNAGIDLEAPGNYAFSELYKLVISSQIDSSLIDEAVKNILTVKFKSGLFDKVYHAPDKVSDMIHTEESINLALDIAKESIILLKNEDDLLPLDITALKSIAVIGPNANQVQYGDYSCTKNNSSGITILEGIQEVVGDKVKINYNQGCTLTGLDESGIPEAVRVAEKSDLIVLVIGGTSMILSDIKESEKQKEDYTTCGEGYDRSCLSPPGVQSKLIQAMYNTGKPVVLILVHGRPYAIAWEKEHIPAILEAWYPGEQGGKAIAHILLGITNPSGKLPVSIPASAGHIPVFYNTKPSGKGFYNQRGTHEKPGRDYVFSSPEPLYPFGHGLSYTGFKYTDLEINMKEVNLSDTISFSIKIKNTGEYIGKEIVQVYINDKVSSVTTPVKVLKGFEKVLVKPDETVAISFSIPVDELGIWDENMNYIIEPGTFELMIGSSSDDIRLNDEFYVVK